MLQIGTIVVGVDDLDQAISFSSDALDYVPREPPSDDWVVLVPRDDAATGAALALMLSQTPRQDHPRLHLDLYADDQQAEVARLVGLGATAVDWDSYPEDPDFVVMADPDGNIFCVIDAGHGNG